jgi:glutamate racemase
MKNRDVPIGIFDSGMGGVSVLAHAIRKLPNERFIYIGDSANAPYGTRSVEELKSLSISICDNLVERGVKAIVVACNTATSASIIQLRERYDIPVIGMEPALKPAVIENMDGNVAVLATDVTLREEKFAKLTERFSDNANIISIPSPSLVELVERGVLDGEEAEKTIMDVFKGVDIEKLSAVVLGCTHFVFLRRTIEKVLGQKVRIYDGNDGTVNQLIRLLKRDDMLIDGHERGAVELVSVKALERADIINTLSEEMVDRSRQLALYYLTSIREDRSDDMDDPYDSSREELINDVERWLIEIISSSRLTEREEKLLRLRYGLDNVNRATFKELLKLMKVRKPDDLKREINSLDRKLFNYIKNKVK